VALASPCPVGESIKLRRQRWYTCEQCAVFVGIQVQRSIQLGSIGYALVLKSVSRIPRGLCTESFSNPYLREIASLLTVSIGLGFGRKFSGQIWVVYGLACECEDFTTIIFIMQ